MINSIIGCGFGKEQVKRWYDGYILKEYHAYNPKAVVGVMLDGTFQSYWSQTSTFHAGYG